MTATPPSTLVRALRLYVDARNASIIEARRQLKIGELDARALLYVADNPGTRPTHLREHLGITSAGITTLIDRLVDRDAVRRDVDPADRRVNRITVTVDLATLPWSALTRFDREFELAVASDDGAKHNDQLAATLTTLVAAVAASRAS